MTSQLLNIPTQFVNVLTDEKKKLREYKYTIIIKSRQQYSSIIDKTLKEYKIQLHQDNQSKINESSTISIESYFILLIKSLEYILQVIPSEYHSLSLITIKSDNVYFLTYINEWILEWKKNNFRDRPFEDKLLYLYKLLNQIHYKIAMCL